MGRGSARAACVFALLFAGCERRAVPTFNHDIAPILYENCASCHRPIDQTSRSPDPICFAGAPFSVLDYETVRARGRQIAQAVSSRTMPPWLPEHGYGDFDHERRLRDDQIELIRRWVERGAPEGDPSARPPLAALPQGWQLGEPDLVVTAPKGFTLPAAGKDVFRNFPIPVPIATTKYVRGIELRADNPRILHHASVGVDRQRVSRRLDGSDGQPGFAAMPDDAVENVYGWSPGKAPFMEPADRAWTLAKGSDLVVQMHLLPGGRPEVVQPSIGLFLSDTPPAHEPLPIRLESKAIDIPPDQADYAIEDRYVLPADVDVISVYPHAHYLAREMKAFATLPDGSVRWLLWIKAWDFRWQDQYRYGTPLFLPKGATLSMRFTYDNSSANLRNPHRPPQRVLWGPQSSDEMGALWLEVLPRRREDIPILLTDFNARSLRADTGGAEMQVRTNPSDPRAHNFLATKYLQAGRIDEAAAELGQAIRLTPSDAEAHSNLAIAYQRQGRTVDALREAREAVRLKPADDRVHFNLANVLMANDPSAGNAAAEAISELRRATALNPGNADAYFNLGVLLGARQQVGEAAAALQRAVDLAPQNAEAHRNLGVAFALLGRLDDGIAEAREAVRIQPDSAAARSSLADLLRARTASASARPPGR
jgi:tetratricopeptide (TPR) repeat protein